MLIASILAATTALFGAATDDSARREMLRASLASCAVDVEPSAGAVRLAAASAFASRMIARGDQSGPALGIARRSWQTVTGILARKEPTLTIGERAMLADCLLDAVQIDGTREHREPAKRLLDELRGEIPGKEVPHAMAGLLLAVLSRGAVVIGDVSYAAAARSVAESLSAAGADGSLRRQDGSAMPAAASDYIAVIHGALAFYQTSGESRWLMWALALQDRLDRESWDEASHAYREDPIAKPFSVAGIAALNLLALETITDDDGFRDRARALLDAAVGRTEGAAVDRRLLCAIDQRIGPRLHLLIVGDPLDDAVHAFVSCAYRTYQPRLVTMIQAGDAAQAELRARFPGMVPNRKVDGKATAYLCTEVLCNSPTTDPAVLEKQLSDTSYRW